MIPLLFVLAQPAHADIPPPQGIKRVSYGVQVQAYDGAGDLRLVVYPWSASNGRPTAGVAVVQPDKRMGFGRRIAGSPAYWSVPASKLDMLLGLDDAALATWFATEGHATRCKGATPSPRHEVSDGGPDAIVDYHEVVKLDATGCELADAPAPAPKTEPPAPPIPDPKLEPAAPPIPTPKPEPKQEPPAPPFPTPDTGSSRCASVPLAVAWPALLLVLPFLRRREA